MEKGVITKVSGPLVVARGLTNAKMYDVVYVGKLGLLGEIIQIKEDLFFIQVYEETSGIGPGEEVLTTGEPLSVELGPGLISSIFDGVQRPLDIISTKFGSYIVRGVKENSLPRDKEWEFEPIVKEGDFVEEGDIIGLVQETEIVKHNILVPPKINGKVKKVFKGKCKIEDPIVILDSNGKEIELKMITR
ncbi:MAG: V-type ATP synthase subunit A, partial [Caldisericia bacterium]|nr:V-type ATP synthase subunit A [Caldisericia bacterium]